MKFRVSTHIFNFRLYVEGLKRLKVIAMATLILAVVISALLPVTHWIERTQHAPVVDLPVYDEEMVADGAKPSSDINVNYSDKEEIELILLCPALYGVMMISPFFLLVLFGFLHKRRECDFFHAVPYTRTCTFISFVSAAITAIIGIIALSTAVAGILWTINPYAEIMAERFVMQALAVMLASVMLSAFMMLAITLTGTVGSSVVFFGFFIAFWRIVLLIFTESCNYAIFPIWDIPYFNADWFFPLRVLTVVNNLNYGQTYASLHDIGNVLYSVIVTVMIFVLSGVVYKLRKSEMAGQTAPNRLLGHIFRCLFSLPFALLIYYLGGNFTEILVIIVVTLLVYYLYELITTKKLKNLLAATPWLLGVLAGFLLFGGIRLGVHYYILHEDIEPEEIRHVTLVNPTEIYGNKNSYEMQYISNHFGDDPKLTTDDTEILTFIADRLYMGQQHELYHQYEDLYTAHTVDVRIKMDDGRTILRTIPVPALDMPVIHYKFSQDLASQKADFKHAELLALSKEDISRVSVSSRDKIRIDMVYVEALIDVYLKEYNALSLQEQTALHAFRINRPENSNIHGYFEIYRNGRGTTFLITDKTPKTRDLLNQIIIESSKS